MTTSLLPEPIYTALLNASNDAIVIYDCAFRFLYVNAEAERLMQFPREGILGKTLWELFPDMAMPFQEPLTRAMRERIPVTFEAEYAPTGRWTEGRCIPLDVPGDEAALAVFFRATTDRHNAESARQRMEFLAEASAFFSSVLDYQATLESMARIVVPHWCDWCAVHMPDPDGLFIEQVAVAHVDPAKVEWARALNRQYPTRADDPQGIARVIRTGEPLFLPEIPEDLLVATAKDEAHLLILRTLGFCSAIAVPLVARGATLGALLLVTTDESGRRLHADDLTFAEELARRAAIAVDNARLFRKAQQDEERFRALIDASSQMVWRTGADGLITDIPEWRTYTGQTEEQVRGNAWMDALHPEDQARVEQTWREALSARAVYECDYRVRGRDGEYRWFFVRGVPLFDEERGTLREYIGTWTNITPQRQAEYEREALLQATQRRAEREALINRISEEIRRLTEPEEILGAVVRELGASLNADRCYFTEYDIAREWSRVGVDWHRPALSSLTGTYRLSEINFDPRQMFGGPEGLRQVDDLMNAASVYSPEAAAFMTQLGLRAILGIAVFENNSPVAALNVAMADAPRAWTADEVEAIRAVAALTRSAMEDARRRKREHNIAEQLQAALQPMLPGKVRGLDMDAVYRPALAEATIGGDFFDVFSLEKGCFALVVADLSGKGLAAAAQVATVRHMLRTLFYQREITAAHAMISLNDMLSEHELVEGFATLFVGVYDVHDRTLTYVNAGQEPGLLLRKMTGSIERMEPTGPVLGGFPGAVYEERKLSLASGDVLALFTDGLTEAGSDRHDMMGIAGIAAVFQESTRDAETAGEIKARMIAGVENLVTPGGIRDDVCLLIACIE